MRIRTYRLVKQLSKSLPNLDIFFPYFKTIIKRSLSTSKINKNYKKLHPLMANEHSLKNHVIMTKYNNYKL